MPLDAAFWDERYQTGDTGWDVGMVSQPLKQYFDTLADKRLRILVPGCGNAYEAAYLHELGFRNVYLLDWSGEVIEAVRKKLPGIPPDHILQEDFFKHKSQEKQGFYDLIVEQTFFCALEPKLRSDYIRKTWQLLRKGGKLAGLLFNDPLPGRDGPPFGGDKTTYELLFKPYFEFIHFEDCYNSIKPRMGRELFIELLKKDQPE